MEREIDEELKYGKEEENNDNAEQIIAPQIVTNNLHDLDNMVKDLVEICSCPTQFPMIRVSDGKYRIGDSKILIFVRILRSHVMVRVGGGWDTLAHYLDKHDPCRCRSQHRSSLSAKVVSQNNNSFDLNGAQVFYERQPQPIVHRKGYNNQTQQEVILSPDSDNGSELSDEGYRSLNFITVNDKSQKNDIELNRSEWPTMRNNTWNGALGEFRKRKRTQLNRDLFRNPDSVQSPIRQAIQLVNDQTAIANRTDSEVLEKIRQLLREYEYDKGAQVSDVHKQSVRSRIPIPVYRRKKSLSKN